jgi:serine/threonine protein kinase
VRIVYHRKANRVFALKMLQKAQIVLLKQQKNIVNEAQLLFRVDHPFVIKLYDVFKDRDRVYMLMDVAPGGELFNRLQTSPTPGRVSASEARFYAACVLDALAYLHAFGVVYRDLKPENLLIDAAGFLKLVDFGFAKVIADRSFTVCGTPEYLAPELLLSQGHGRGVDYWALGILLFEMVAGYSPFSDAVDADQVVICRNILHGSVDFPAHVRDKDLRDVVAKLLTRDVSRRVGCLRGGAADVRAQKFFTTVDWEELRALRAPSPWLPSIASALDTSNFDAYDERDAIAPYVASTAPGANEWEEFFA